MKWISVKDQLPPAGIIVALMGGRQQQANDLVEDVKIVILRSDIFSDGLREFVTLDDLEHYYLSTEHYSGRQVDIGYDIWHCIEYWVEWNYFPFPASMIVKKDSE